ncbi:hypothetical protein ABIB66_008249 [Bradyrhizobium sp. F1.13.3]
MVVLLVCSCAYHARAQFAALHGGSKEATAAARFGMVSPAPALPATVASTWSWMTEETFSPVPILALTT